MGRGFGIAALVIVLLSIPIPVVGPWIAFIGLLLAVGAALGGDKPFTIAVVLIAAVKLYLITPTWLFFMQNPLFAGITFVMIALPVAALAFRLLTGQKSKAGSSL